MTTVCVEVRGGISLPIDFFLKFVLEVNVLTTILAAVKVLPTVIVIGQFNCCRELWIFFFFLFFFPDVIYILHK